MDDFEESHGGSQTCPKDGEAEKTEASILAINSLTKELERQRCETRASERDKGLREKITIALVALTLGATGYGDFVFHQTMMDARDAATKAQADNARALDEARFTSFNALIGSRIDSEKAIANARIASDAALDRADTANANARTFQAVNQRATVYFDAPKFALENDPANKMWEILGGIGNSGNEQTSGLEIQEACISSPVPIDDPFADPRYINGVKTHYALGPKVSFTPIACTYSAASMRDIIARKLKFYVFGRATYRNVLKPSDGRITEFCYEMTGLKTDPSETTIGSYANPCIRHNCADRECKR